MEPNPWPTPTHLPCTGGATMVEFCVPVPGSLTLIDHSVFRTDKGAVGFLKVGPSGARGEVGGVSEQRGLWKCVADAAWAGQAGLPLIRHPPPAACSPSPCHAHARPCCRVPQACRCDPSAATSGATFVSGPAQA